MRLNVFLQKKVSISEIFLILHTFSPIHPSIYKNRRLSSPHDSIHESHAIVKALNLYLNAGKSKEEKKNFLSVNV